MFPYLMAPGTSESHGTAPSVVSTNLPFALWTLSLRNIETWNMTRVRHTVRKKYYDVSWKRATIAKLYASCKSLSYCLTLFGAHHGQRHTKEQVVKWVWKLIHD